MTQVARDAGGEGVETHIIVAVVSTAAFALGAAWSGVGVSELCKLAGAIVVGALAVSAASTLIRRQLGHQIELRPLLASTALTVLRSHARLPAARVVRVALEPQPSTAVASVESLGDAAVLRLALSPALHLVPGVRAAFEAHDAYQSCLESARFVRTFARTAAELCPVPLPAPCPAPLPALCA